MWTACVKTTLSRAGWADRSFQPVELSCSRCDSEIHSIN
jgi:hypothetical protein